MKTTSKEAPKEGLPATPTSPVEVAGATFGGTDFQVIAGPCSIESELHFSQTALAVKNSGATALRGGIYKMRTNPESFQGLGDRALDFAKKVSQNTNLPLVTEVTDARQIEKLDDVVAMFQVGSRNMYNYALLKELGMSRKPVMLKRGLSATVEEWLLAAEYLVHGGNSNVILCERGIRTFEKITRNTLDLSSVAYIKQNTDFPVIVDPSHATGVPALIEPMSLAAAAAGADGLLIEIHDRPAEAMSDGFQALTYSKFNQLMSKLKSLLTHLDRPLATVQPTAPAATSSTPQVSL